MFHYPCQFPQNLPYFSEPFTRLHPADDPVHPGDAAGVEGARPEVVRGGGAAGEVRGDVIP